MCGVSAIVSWTAGDLAAPLAAMVASQRHRGPDGEGCHIVANDPVYRLGLGHNRLAILDLSDHARQPMVSDDGNCALSYNGEIYNYKELAFELGMSRDGHPVRGDTEVVLVALQTWGAEAFARFNGMWSILFHDRRTHSLLVSRDRLGIKPLYYFDSGDTMYFASEIKAILKATNARFRLNARAAVPYLTRGLLDTGRETFFEGIQNFAPGTCQVIDLHSHTIGEPKPFWLHPFKRGGHMAPGNVRDLKEMLLDSVRIQLRSDVPVGVLLSGGIDSSAILGAATRHAGPGNVMCLSVISDDPKSDESPFIRTMAAHAQADPILINVSNDPLTLLEMIPDATWANDQPLCGLADVAHLMLMGRARELGIKVLLSGQGSDEEFGGYNKFFYFYLQDLMRRHRYLRACGIACASAIHTNTLYEFRMAEALRYLKPSKLRDETFIRPEVRHADTLATGLGRSYQERECRDLLELSLPQLLHFEDRMSMSQSVEVRVPFLDHRLVELAAAITPDDKFRGGWSKSILRDAIADLVPPKIRFRKDKKGFNVPEAVWMRAEFIGPYRRMLAQPMLAHEFGIVDQAKAGSHYAAFLEGKGFLNARHFFRLYLFESFLRRFKDHIEPTGAGRCFVDSSSRRTHKPDPYIRLYMSPSPTLPRRVGVIDLATGNIGSVLKMLDRIGANPTVCASPKDIDGTSPIVIPGVGHFSNAVQNLDAAHWRGKLSDLHKEGRPILGICLGAQLFCQRSEEGGGAGLGWIPAVVRRFPSIDVEGKLLRVPHMGWQGFSPPEGCFPFSAPAGRMYYAQSYFIEPTRDPAYSPYQSDYGGVRFASAVRSNNAIGVQFHPEKSHRHGMALLSHWMQWASGCQS